MGCDIHLHQEIKIKGQWHHYSIFNTPRSYRIFGLMAGVRDESIGAVSEPKGLPEDMTLITSLHYEDWKLDAHSMSWLNAEEINLLGERARDEMTGFEEHEFFGYLFGNYFSWFIRYKSDYPEFVEDIRFVFWFDN